MSARKASPPPHRVRLTVPHDDDVTLEWLAAQFSASASIRMLIREVMMAHGPIDALSRPLEARPLPAATAADPLDTAARAPARSRTRSTTPVQDPAADVDDAAEVDEPDEPQQAPASAADVDDAAVVEDELVAEQPVPEQLEQPASEQPRVPEGNGLGGVGDFFSSNRD